VEGFAQRKISLLEFRMTWVYLQTCRQQKKAVNGPADFYTMDNKMCFARIKFMERTNEIRLKKHKIAASAV